MNKFIFIQLKFKLVDVKWRFHILFALLHFSNYRCETFWLLLADFSFYQCFYCFLFCDFLPLKVTYDCTFIAIQNITISIKRFVCIFFKFRVWVMFYNINILIFFITLWIVTQQMNKSEALFITKQFKQILYIYIVIYHFKVNFASHRFSNHGWYFFRQINIVLLRVVLTLLRYKRISW